MSELKCGQCGHENDPTRVFCQNCGTRLERTDAAPAGPSTTPAPVKRKSERPKGLTLPGALLQIVRGLLSLAFLGALIALFIQLGRSPDGVPPVAMADDVQTGAIIDALKANSTNQFRRTQDLTQEQINMVLASRLAMAVPAEGSAFSVGAKFHRAFVVCDDGMFRFGVERKYLGLSVYFWVDCKAQVGPEGISAVVKNGGIGRVPLDPRLLEPMQARVITPTVDALGQPLEIFRTATQIAIEPGLVHLAWPGRPPGR